MNRLEADARPFLTALIEGTPIVLDYAQMALIARWITLKVMVVEHSTHDTAVTTRYQRETFRTTGEIPYFYRIYLGSHDGPQLAAMFRDARCITYQGVHHDPPLGGVSNNIQTITMYLGKVFVYVNAARVNGFEIEKGLTAPKLYRQRIWPLMNGEHVWPSRPVFTVEQVNVIANGLNALFNHNAWGWLPDGFLPRGG